MYRLEYYTCLKDKKLNVNISTSSYVNISMLIFLQAVSIRDLPRFIFDKRLPQVSTDVQQTTTSQWKGEQLTLQATLNPGAPERK